MGGLLPGHGARRRRGFLRDRRRASAAGARLGGPSIPASGATGTGPATAPRRGPRDNGVVTAPLRAIPTEVERWISRVRYLRGLDALAGVVALWAVAALALPGLAVDLHALLALGIVGSLALVPPVRARWRPVSGAVALAMSRDVRPGDQAWWVRAGRADLVLVTARRGARLVLALPGHDAREAVSVRRTRTLVLPAELRRARRQERP